MSVQRIMESLSLLNDLHKQLIDIAEEKKQVIIKNDVEGLSQLMTKESRLLKRVAEADEDRLQAAQEFILEKGIRSQLNLTVTEITRLVFNAEEREQIVSLRDNLSNTINKLKVKNDQNQDLLRQSLEFIDFSINIFMGAEDDGIYRADSAQAYGHQRNKLFDTKA
ncbi:flagellar protein FlgN [Paenibacillus sp. MER 180]|uniref:flagellar protein FlgN n=1 Tax=Paenibacillus sp. MER 180 TaxID=2939570 RepID=UPI00203B377F|nr:flagellar protein FlgN [Paenibacillus sp. MER 180]MCM3288573.1 flagellar protein FlgN [Paenibacillus sp. MER 180]